MAIKIDSSSTPALGLLSRLKAWGMILPVLLALTAAALSYIYAPMLTDEKQLYISDHTFYFEPFTHFIADSFRKGKVPLWNPYLYSGMSQIAVPSPGVFYLPHGIYALLNYSQSMAVLMIFHQLIAFAGAFLLVESLGWGLTAACVAAATVAFCGYMFSLSTNFSLVETASWIPFLLWSFRRIFISQAAGDRRSTEWAICAGAISFAMMIAAGRPEVFAPAGVLLAVYLLRLVWLKGTKALPALICSGCALMLGALLAMPIILPILEWLKISPRASGMKVEFVLMWSANWYDIFCMFFAQPLGDLQILGADFLRLVTTRPIFMPYVPSTYVGPIAFTLAVFGFADKTWSWRLLAALGLLVTTIFCLGEYTPIAPYLVKSIPLLSVFRYPIKWIIFPILIIAFAAGRGTHCLLRHKTGTTAEIFTWTIWTLSLAASALFMYLGKSGIALEIARPDVPAAMEILLSNSMGIGAAIGLLTCALIAFYRRNRITAHAFSLALMTLLTANLLVTAHHFRQDLAFKEYYRQPASLKEKLISTSPKNEPLPKLLALYFDPLSVPTDYHPQPGTPWNPTFFQYARQVLLPNCNVSQDVKETFGYEAGETGFYRSSYLSAMHRSTIATKVTKAANPKEGEISDYPLYRFCQSTATHWVATQLRHNQEDLPLLDQRYFAHNVDDKSLNIRLYSVRDSLPRAYLAPNFRWMGSDEELKEAITMPEQSGFNPQSVTLVKRLDKYISEYELASNPEAPKIGLPPLAPPHPVAERRGITAAQVMLDQSEHVAISVDAQYDGFLVLTDHYYPGWTALVDSLPRPIYKVNTEMRGVWLPKGPHLVEFNFKPECLSTAVILLLTGIALLTVLALEASGPFLLRVLKMMAGQA